MLQEKDIEVLLKRKEKVNTQIEMIEKQNEEIKSEIVKGIKELKEIGIEINKDNLDEQYEKFSKLLQEQYDNLKKEVEIAEKELEGII